MKKSESKKELGSLKNQKVDSTKIQGGGARPEPVPLTKDNALDVGTGGGVSAVATGMTSDLESDGSILTRRGIRKPKGQS